MNKNKFSKGIRKNNNGIVKNNEKPKLLLHACCAPCSSYVLEYLSNYFLITVLFFLIPFDNLFYSFTYKEASADANASTSL